MRLAARVLSRAASTSRRLVHYFGKPFALRSIKQQLRPVYHVVFVQQQRRWTRNYIYILLHLALYLRHRRIYVTEEAFECVQYFADGVNEGSSITFCQKCACTALRSCLSRQGNERTASTSFSSQSILRCGIVIARIILLAT